jgi:hypothetical protein
MLKPTHMIGGYAQLAYGFNYYGTVGSNRDEFVVVRKMNKVDWMDEVAPAGTEAFRRPFIKQAVTQKNALSDGLIILFTHRPKQA